MKEVEYIIVGCGLAGISFCEELRAHGKSFVVFDDHSQQSSNIAAGVYNPVVLKRFTAVWKAKEQLKMVASLYEGLEKLLGINLDYKLPVYRRFSSIEEQNDWFNASDRASLEDYLSPKVIPNDNSGIVAPFGFGKVLETGRIDTSTLLKHYKLFLKTINSYIFETFDYDAILFQEAEVNYKNIKANYIVFAEGYGMLKNSFFKYLPLNEAKGEVLLVKAPELKMEFILKSSVFIVPVLDDYYSVGATYNWEDKTHDITEGAKTELLSKLKKIISCDYEVINQLAGIRPTVIDRKPLVGRHPKHNNIAILNGLGTHGVMIGPYVSQQLFLHLENGTPLDAEIDIKRFQIKN